jgi:hypothetical protein
LIADIWMHAEPHSKVCYLLHADVCSCRESGGIVPFAWKVFLFLDVGEHRFTLWHMKEALQENEVSLTLNFYGIPRKVT